MPDNQQIDGFVDKDGVETLTGKKRYAAQCRVLTEQGIDYYVAADGRPIVLWSTLRRERKRARREGPRLEGLARR